MIFHDLPFAPLMMGDAVVPHYVVVIDKFTQTSLQRTTPELAAQS